QSVSTQSSSFDSLPSSFENHASSLDERVLSANHHRSQSDATALQLRAATNDCHYNLSLWSANSSSNESTSSSIEFEQEHIKPDLDDLEMRRTARLGEFDLDLEDLTVANDAHSNDIYELDADLRPTEALGVFDLDMDISSAHDGTTDSGRADKLRRTHHELVFANSRWRGGREKERFLSDLYASPAPPRHQRRQNKV
ncbi:hypothetical protein Gpo141_00003452, partial [Globisporangium polare]